MREKLNKQMKRFNFLVNEINSAYHEAALRLRLSDSAFQVLYTVCSSEGDCTISDICSWGISKQTVNSALRKLESEDLVYLENAGGKRKRVCLTRKGQALSETTVLKIIEIENQIFSSWEKDEVTAYVGLTERYLRMFRESAEREL